MGSQHVTALGGKGVRRLGCLNPSSFNHPLASGLRPVRACVGVGSELVCGWTSIRGFAQGLGFCVPASGLAVGWQVKWIRPSGQRAGLCGHASPPCLRGWRHTRGSNGATRCPIWRLAPLPVPLPCRPVHAPHRVASTAKWLRLGGNPRRSSMSWEIEVLERRRAISMSAPRHDSSTVRSAFSFALLQHNGVHPVRMDSVCPSRHRRITS